jgi:hypothetical protein
MLIPSSVGDDGGDADGDELGAGATVGEDDGKGEGDADGEADDDELGAGTTADSCTPALSLVLDFRTMEKTSADKRKNTTMQTTTTIVVSMPAASPAASLVGAAVGDDEGNEDG